MSQLRSTDMVEELAKDYAAYANINLSAEVKGIHDSVEDAMTRLEEFESIVGMVEAERTELVDGRLHRLLPLKTELLYLCKKIDNLEYIVARANSDLSVLEAAVENAEADLGTSDRVFGILNTLPFFKKQDPMANRRTTFEPPDIYKTEDFFEAM